MNQDPETRHRTSSSFWSFLAAAAVVGLPVTGAHAQATGGGTGASLIQVDLNQTVGEMYPMWAYFGYDEANYTTTWEGEKLLTELAELSPVPVYIRAHQMLNTHEGNPVAFKWGSTNAYTEDEDGNPVYDWETMDELVDTWIDRGMKPLMEMGFMPKALSTNPEPYRHDWQPGDPYGRIYTGWSYPPNDYEKWGELIFQWVTHSVERYGADEVETWWWQLWNEPDGTYWQGTTEEYTKLYDYTADAVKRALPTARVGGPNVTGVTNNRQTSFMTTFLDHVTSGTNFVTGEQGTPIDFIGFHAKGSPNFINGHVRTNMQPELRHFDNAFEMIASYPALRDLPVIIGEADPEGCAACSVASGSPQNAYRNGTMYSSYTAASFTRMYELADKHGTNLEGVTSWAFTFPGQPWFDGFRELATNGVDKPVLNVFRMFAQMSGNRVAVTGNSMGADDIVANAVRGPEADISAMATRDENEAAVMVWNYHDDDLPAPDAEIVLGISGIPANRVLVHHYRIDEDHSNAYTTWLEMGAPQQVTREQYGTLEADGKLELLDAPVYVDATDGSVTIDFDLPRTGVSLLTLSW